MTTIEHLQTQRSALSPWEPVLFRTSKRNWREVCAVFPCWPYDLAGTHSVMFTPRHTFEPCDPETFRWKNRPAPPQMYRHLKAELEYRGFRLEIYRRCPRGFREIRAQRAREREKLLPACI